MADDYVDPADPYGVLSGPSEPGWQPSVVPPGQPTYDYTTPQYDPPPADYTTPAAPRQPQPPKKMPTLRQAARVALGLPPDAPEGQPDALAPFVPDVTPSAPSLPVGGAGGTGTSGGAGPGYDPNDPFGLGRQRPPGAGYGYRPQPIEPLYFAPGYKQSVLDEYETAKDQLQQAMFTPGVDPETGKPLAMTPAEYQKQLQALQDARDEKLLKLATYEASPQGIKTKIARSMQEEEALMLQSQGFQAQNEAEALQMRTMARRSAIQGLQQAHEDFQQREARIRADVSKEIDGYRSAIADLESTQLDSRRWWKNKTTGEKIAAGFAMILGTAGAALGRTPNQVADMFEREATRDLQLQLAEVGAKKAGVGNRFNLINLMRQKFGDNERAFQASQAYIYQKLGLRAQAYADNAASKTARSKAGALAKLMQLRADRTEDMIRLDAVNRAMALEMQRQAAAYAAAHKPEQSTGPGEFILDEGDLPKEWKPMPGLGLAVRGDISAKAIEGIQANRELAMLAEEALQPGSKFNLQDRAQVAQLISQMKLAYNQGKGAGALDAGSLPLYEDIFGNPNSLTDLGQAKVKLGTVARGARAKAEELAQSVGLVQAKQVWVKPDKSDPKNPNKLKPVWLLKGAPGQPVQVPYNPIPVQTGGPQ